jgi:hypothetical protein
MAGRSHGDIPLLIAKKHLSLGCSRDARIYELHEQVRCAAVDIYHVGFSSTFLETTLIVTLWAIWAGRRKPMY